LPTARVGGLNRVASSGVSDEEMIAPGSRASAGGRRAVGSDPSPF